MRGMTNSTSSDNQQEHGGQEQSAHGEASEHGHTGEGSASALAHMLSQDQKHRKQNAEPEDAPAGRGHS